jgi:hypothetical protein
MYKLDALIHARWLLIPEREEFETDIEFLLVPARQVVVEETPGESLTPVQRYCRLNAMCQPVASLGGKTKQSYAMVMSDLEDLLKKLTQPESVQTGNPVDANGIRAGRPRKIRTSVESKTRRNSARCSSVKTGGKGGSCRICDGGHRTDLCPDLRKLKLFIRPGDAKPGKICSACHQTGHYVSRCPAIRRFRAARTRDNSTKRTAVPEPNEPQMASEASESEISSDQPDIEVSSDYSELATALELGETETGSEFSETELSSDSDQIGMSSGSGDD